MRKLLVLLLAAAVVGIVISNTRQKPAVVPAGDTLAEETAAPSAAPGPPAAAAAPAEEPAVTVQRESRPRASQSSTAERTEAPAPVKRVVLSAAADRQPAVAPKRQAERDAGPAPESDASAVAALDRAAALLESGRRVEARQILTELYLPARGRLAVKVREVLDYISSDLVFNPRCVEGAAIHVVQPGETLSKVGKQHGVSWRMVQRINGMDHDRIKVGQQLKILPGRASLVVCRSEFRLALLLDGAYAKEYRIGVGEGDKTPTGRFVVANMLVRPRWYKPGGGIMEYGDEGNLLGERWIGFDDQPGASGLGIHGTNDDSSIGTKCSNGCLRMHNADVIELYDFLQPGDVVEIRD